MALSATQQLLLAAVPETGEISYDDLRKTLITGSDQQRRALYEFHDMRRANALVVRTVKNDETNELTLFVSRPKSA